MIYFDSQTTIQEKQAIEELSGNLSPQKEEDKLMRSVVENDQETIEEGKVIEESINQGMNSFTPDLMYEKMVQNYQLAEHLYGKTLLQLLTGYDPDFAKKNIKIPEFQRELRLKMDEVGKKLKKDKLIDGEGEFTHAGVGLASLVAYFEELDKMQLHGMLGSRVHKKKSKHGDKEDVRPYRKGDRYRDIAIKASAKKALRRGHAELRTDDLMIYERQKKGKSYIIYALDASGSMKGAKIAACKRAGIALAFNAIQQKDEVGLIEFGTDVKNSIAPTDDFKFLLHNITSCRASKQTDLKATITKAIELFPPEQATKHLILITDALPTIGTDPEKAALKEASRAANEGITISLVGINLDEKGKKLADKLVEVGQGKLYSINDVDTIDKVVLEDYYESG